MDIWTYWKPGPKHIHSIWSPLPSPPPPKINTDRREKETPGRQTWDKHWSTHRFIAKWNEPKCERWEKKWNTKLNQRLYNQRTVRPLKQREEIKSISTPGCFFSNPVASHLMILINSTSTALWISSNVKLLNFDSQVRLKS